MVTPGRWKLVLVVGSGVAVLAIVGFMGVASWYAGRINAEYKEVGDSEKALRAATGQLGAYLPPAGGIPAPDRLEVFLEVREELSSWRRTMATASARFAADRERQREGGLKELLKLFGTGSDLMPLYAGFWTARNQTLLAHGMGPEEYAYIYRLVYDTLGDGDPEGAPPGGVSQEALARALDPYRETLTRTFDPVVDPVELIFQEEEIGAPSH